MGKGILVFVAAFVISFMYYNTARYQTSMETRGQTADYQYKTLSQQASRSGLSLARQAIADGKDAAVFTANLSDGFYRSVLSRGGATYRIESQGGMTDTRSRLVGWVIRADYIREPRATATEVPPFLEYILLTGGDLELRGSATSDLTAFGNAHNANVHTNGTLTIVGNHVRVAGFGTHSQHASANPTTALETSFAPAINETDRHSVFQVPSIEIPEFTVADHLEKVVPDMISGPVSLSGEYNLGGTREDPYVWLINGDLSLSGNTTIDGYAMFLVDGSVTMSGNVEAGIASWGSPESTMAFYADGNVTLSGTDDIHAQLLADGDLTVVGTPTIYGTITTRGSATLNGTPHLHYVKASPALAQIWNDGREQDRYRMVSYHETLEGTISNETTLFPTGASAAGG